MTLEDLIIDDGELGSDKIVKFVKEKETYRFYNISEYFTSYSIEYKGCKLNVSSITGSIDIDGNFVFTPEREGEFILTFRANNLNDTIRLKETVFIAHYPSIITSVITSTKDALCSCNCDCNDNCNIFKDLFAETQLLLNLYRSISSESAISIINSFLYRAYDLYRCDLITLFCNKQVDLKTKGRHKSSDTLFKKVTAINYLAFYFYELFITNPLDEFVTYHNRKYKFKEVKDCLLKTGIEITTLQIIFEQITTVFETEPVCSNGCISNTVVPTVEEFSFLVDTIVNGTYHNVSITNVCSNDQVFFNRLLYKDDDFKVAVTSTSSNPAIILPNGTLGLNISFTGTKHIPAVITIPFKEQGILISTYIIRFINPEAPNTPPVIVDIIKELENRNPYTFTIADFETHFTDADGDILDRIVITGDTTRFTLFGQPYISGTEINRLNITSLVYIPLDTDNVYQVVLQWMAYDSYGLSSN